MQEGFTLERGMAVRWLAGNPETSIFDLKANREQRCIETYRCAGCGYLESYARTEIS